MANPVETLIRNGVAKAVMKVADFNRGRMEPVSDHPYLTGLHTPMTQEVSLDALKVTGKIPPELGGRYIRIGPNPINADPASYHWFTGDGMVHGVRLKAGKAQWYRNRWIRSSKVSQALGEAPAPGPRSPNFDTVNTNIVGHAGEAWAIVEAGGFPVRIDKNLETIAHDPFGGSLKNAFTAHPHLDPATGEMHAITYKGDVPNRIWHVVVDAQGNVRREIPIPVKHGPMIHDCMITKNYVIILDFPCTFSMKALVAGHAFPYRWNPDHQARVGLLPREGSADDIIWCGVDPCFIFHPANAYETGDDTIIFDACVHDTMFAKSAHGPDSKRVPFERWTINLKSRRIDRAVIDDQSQEFPRPDERFTGQPYRYAFTMALDNFEGMDGTRIFRHDLVAKTRQTHDFGAGCHPGEFVFVPKSADAAEGDGWLMGYVIDTNDGTTDLVILSAMNFEAPPVARITIPHIIPPGFHGNWIAD